MKYHWTLRLALWMTLLLGCTNTDGSADAEHRDTGPSPQADASMEPEESNPVFTHKLIKKTGENPFASLAYECPQCTFEQWASIDPPEGWTKGPAQVATFSEQYSSMRSYPSAEGHSDSVNFLDDVPGNEYRIIAINHSGRLVKAGPAGVVAEVQVQRDTLLVFTSGMRVHELTDPEGGIFVLFAHHVDTGDWEDVDYQSEDALAYFTPPPDWTYSTRILEEDLVLDSDNHEGVVSVLAIRGTINSTWEKR